MKIASATATTPVEEEDLRGEAGEDQQDLAGTTPHSEGHRAPEVQDGLVEEDTLPGVQEEPAQDVQAQHAAAGHTQQSTGQPIGWPRRLKQPVNKF